MAKKVLIIITKGDIGGAQVFAFNLAQGLKKKGCYVVVGFGEGDFLGSRLEEAGIPTVRFKYLQRTRNPFSNLLFVLELRSFLKHASYDVVQFNSSNSLSGTLGAKLASRKIKTVFTIHGLSTLDKNYKTFPPLKFTYWLFFKFFLLFVDAPVFVAKHNLKEAQNLGIVKSGAVIYNGLDTSALHFMPRENARDFIATKIGHDPTSLFIIGSIGRLSYQKNYEFLIRSFPDILAIKKNAVAVIIGDGPERSAAEASIKALCLQDKIFLLGGYNNAAEYLKAFDLFVLPSRYEGLPITLTECLFAEIPVLASDVGGNNEIANERSLYRLDDKAEFLKKISDVVDKRSLYICDRSKKELFSLNKMSEGYFNLFEELSRS